MSTPACPQCQSEYCYPDQNQFICPECAYEWNPEALAAEAEAKAVRDINGAILTAGDKATLVKDLKVKGSSLVLKIGTKVQIRRVIEAPDHQLDCKISAGSDMMITAKFVKKS